MTEKKTCDPECTDCCIKAIKYLTDALGCCRAQHAKHKADGNDAACCLCDEAAAYTVAAIQKHLECLTSHCDATAKVAAGAPDWQALLKEILALLEQFLKPHEA